MYHATGRDINICSIPIGTVQMNVDKVMENDDEKCNKCKTYQQKPRTKSQSYTLGI